MFNHIHMHDLARIISWKKVLHLPWHHPPGRSDAVASSLSSVSGSHHQSLREPARSEATRHQPEGTRDDGRVGREQLNAVESQTQEDIRVSHPFYHTDVQIWDSSVSIHCAVLMSIHQYCETADNHCWLRLLTSMADWDCWHPWLTEMLTSMADCDCWHPWLTETADIHGWLRLLTSMADCDCWHPWLTETADIHGWLRDCCHPWLIETADIHGWQTADIHVWLWLLTFTADWDCWHPWLTDCWHPWFTETADIHGWLRDCCQPVLTVRLLTSNADCVSLLLQALWRSQWTHTQETALYCTCNLPAGACGVVVYTSGF